MEGGVRVTLSLQLAEQFSLRGAGELRVAHVRGAALPAARAGALGVAGRVLALGVGRPAPAALHGSDARYDLVLAQRAPLQALFGEQTDQSDRGTEVPSVFLASFVFVRHR